MSANKNPHARTSQEMDNLSFDDTYNQNTQLMLGEDGATLRKVAVNTDGTLKTPELTLRAYNDGTYDYIAEAQPASATSAAVWRIIRVDSSGNIIYADGDTNFDNIADNYSSISYF